MKHIKLFEGFLNEGSYDDFLDNYHDELKDAIVKLSALGKVYDEIDEKIGEEIGEEIEKRLSVYDDNVSSQIMDWIVSGHTIRKNDIVDFAFKNMNRYGTEMQMVLYAIDDYYDVVGEFVPVEASKIMKRVGESKFEEMQIDVVNESESKDKKELQDALDKVAVDYWEKRGAKFGKEQTLKDFSFDKENHGGTPVRFNEDTKFITDSASIEAGGYDGRRIVCALWIIPYKKDGSKGQMIRLTWGYASK